MSALPESVHDKMCLAYSYACQILYLDESGRVRKTLPPDPDDIIGCYVDGLMASYVDRMIHGRCSLAASIAFDIIEWEKKVEGHIKFLRESAKSIGVELTDPEWVAESTLEKAN